MTSLQGKIINLSISTFNIDENKFLGNTRIDINENIRHYGIKFEGIKLNGNKAAIRHEQ